MDLVFVWLKFAYKPLAYMNATSPIEVDVRKWFFAAYVHGWYYPFG